MSFIKNRRKYFTSLIISILLLIIIATQFTYPTINTSYRTSLLEQMENTDDFEAFTASLFCYEITSDSVTTAYTLNNPETFNIPRLSPTLTSFTTSQNNEKKNDSINQIIKNSLSHFQPETLSLSDHMTYELLEKTITLNSQLNAFPYYQELLGSSNGIQANLPVTLGEYPLDNKEDILTYLSLLKQVPDYFQAVIKYEAKKQECNLSKYELIYPETLKTMETILEGLQGNDNSFIQTFNERIDQITTLTNQQKKYYKKKNAKYVKKYIIPAYNTLYDYLKSNSEKNNTIQKNISYGLSSLPKGKDYYRLLVKQSTGSGKSPEEIISMTETTLTSSLDKVLDTALEDPTLYSYYVNHEMPVYYNSPENTLYSLSLFIRKDYPLLSKTPSYQVKNVSESLSSSLSPAFFMIPAIDNDTDNTIYINSLYTNAQNGNLFATLAHEGFPGHLYQTLYFNETHPNPLRQILDYPGYVEGWATYVELESYHYLEYPIGKEKLCDLYQGDTIISLALSSRIDLGVNYENWTLQDVENLFEKYGFQPYYAKELYTYVVEAPANYLSYFIGYLEIQELKKAYRITTGDNYKEIDFHKHFLDLGPCDFETAKKYLFPEK